MLHSRKKVPLYLTFSAYINYFSSDNRKYLQNNKKVAVIIKSCEKLHYQLPGVLGFWDAVKKAKVIKTCPTIPSRLSHRVPMMDLLNFNYRNYYSCIARAPKFSNHYMLLKYYITYL